MALHESSARAGALDTHMRASPLRLVVCIALTIRPVNMLITACCVRTCQAVGAHESQTKLVARKSTLEMSAHGSECSQ